MNNMKELTGFDLLVANAILGIDTLWGGDVTPPSGTGRFIADSWFADAYLPPAYAHETAARLRESGGISAQEPDRAAIEAYLAAIDVRGAIRPLRKHTQLQLAFTHLHHGASHGRFCR